MLGKKNAPQGPKVLDVDASLQGNLIFKDQVNLHINGSFEGRLETKGDLLIGEHAQVKANIVGERITVAGQVTGDIVALTGIKLEATARVTGDITAPRLVVVEGAVFQGHSRMGAGQQGEVRENGARRVFLTIDEVANYLSVEGSLISQWAENGKLPGSRDGQSWRFEKQKVDEWIANGRIA